MSYSRLEKTVAASSLAVVVAVAAITFRGTPQSNEPIQPQTEITQSTSSDYVSARGPLSDTLSSRGARSSHRTPSSPLTEEKLKTDGQAAPAPTEIASQIRADLGKRYGPGNGAGSAGSKPASEASGAQADAQTADTLDQAKTTAPKAEAKAVAQPTATPRAEAKAVTQPTPTPKAVAKFDTSRTTTAARKLTMQESFIQKVGPAAQESQRETGVPASVTLAQAILESDWGRSALATEANNLFGIKATSSQGSAGTVWMDTWEVIGGGNVTVSAPFRAYVDQGDSIQDHGLYLANTPRYKQAMQNSSDARLFAQLIHKAGYATDPAYSSKLVKLMDTYNLYAYDVAKSAPVLRKAMIPQ